jgi:hypothetical protein
MVIPMDSKALRLFAIALGCCLFGACSSDPSDGDGDGFDTVSDCNDANAAVHPNALENCSDKLDNDCDLAVDGADADCGDASGG